MVPGRFALSGVAAAALCLVLPSAWALGLGRMVVQSSLGEGLRAEIDVSSLTPEEAANLKVRIASPESYRAAGVDYNAVLPSAQVSLQRRSDGRPYLRIVSDKVVQEPFVDVILELNWNTGRLVREYTMLFDPPSTRTQVATPATPAVVAAAPAPAPSAPAPAQPRVAAAPPPVARAAEPRAAAPKPAAPAPAPSAPAAAPKAAPAAPAAASAEGYRVQSGDTLSGIAGRVQPQGLSLDQMLVALYRANPQAFVDNNMNRLKSGVVLTVPEADAAKAVSTTEAKQVIQAQSADFAAYRQRLAGAVAPAATEGASRQASGKVQAEVEDRKQASAPTPDKLTLSKGSASAKASAPEAQLSREREAKDAATRTAELQKNVEELKKLTAAAKPASEVGATGAAVAAAAAASAPGLNVTAASPLPAPPTPPTSAPAVAAAPAASAASAPSAATVAQAPAASVPAAASAAAPAPKAAAASRPAVAAATPPAAPQGPGLMDTLLEDPMALAGGGLVVALLGGLGVYRYVKRSRKESGETSFLESRLQPDSFFGVSGGQRVDTSEAAAGPASSMSYSLSQLDAIGDVDPVAEADVYLAYGRDLQAEEILKEAIRGNPSRLAIRSKLLEVYAKRRDTKGFELLALQMYSLTQGQGEEWAAAQELGSQIDPDNPLYRPGGRPAQAEGDDGRPFEPLGASTMPQSVLPSPSKFGEVAAAAAAAGAANAAADEIDFSLDLDLDLGVPTADEAAPPRLPEITQPMTEMTQPMLPPAATGGDLAFDLPLESPTEVLTVVAPPPSRDLSLDFDLSGISLDLDTPPVSAPMPLAEVSERSYGDTGEAGEGGDDDVDPFERKLELAEEFRQIGDMDGARDLLEEVIAQTGGAIQAKARNMLDNLS